MVAHAIADLELLAIPCPPPVHAQEFPARGNLLSASKLLPTQTSVRCLTIRDCPRRSRPTGKQSSGCGGSRLRLCNFSRQQSRLADSCCDRQGYRPHEGEMMMRSVEQKNGEAGSGLVEFAPASVIILTVLFGIRDMGRALYAYDWVSDAARRGTRYAMVRGTSSCTGSPELPDCKADLGHITTYVESNAVGLDPR